MALLALLLAERDVLTRFSGRTPLMLLDDVMSELDSSRRELLVAVLSDEGQSVITTTDPEHVPTRHVKSVLKLSVSPGSIKQSDDDVDGFSSRAAA